MPKTHVKEEFIMWWNMLHMEYYMHFFRNAPKLIHFLFLIDRVLFFEMPHFLHLITIILSLWSIILQKIFSSNYFFEIISYQNYIICRIAIFGMIYFQRTVAKWYFAEWHISKHFFAESRLRNIWLPNSLFPNFQFPNIFCRIVLPYGSVAECLFCRMVFCRMCFLRNIVAEWPTLHLMLSFQKKQSAYCCCIHFSFPSNL